MTFPPGADARWCGQTVRVVDHDSNKLLAQHRKPKFDHLRLVVAANGQLVWVNVLDLTELP